MKSSYSNDDVEILLKDISGLVEPLPDLSKDSLLHTCRRDSPDPNASSGIPTFGKLYVCVQQCARNLLSPYGEGGLCAGRKAVSKKER